MPTNDPRPTKAVRRDEARLKAAQMRKEQERKARRNRIVGISVIVVAVLALGGVVFSIVHNQKTNEANNSSVAYGGGGSDVIPPKIADVVAPAPAKANGGIPVSGPDAADVGKVGSGDTVLTYYFDFMCPICGQFEKINGADLDTIQSAGGTTIEYHPISFLDANSSGTHYSTRAANAAAVVADKDPAHFAKFVSEMYKNQPAEGSSGLTDDQIAKIATDLGVPKSVADTFTTTVAGTYETGSTSNPTSNNGTWRTFAPWAAAATNQMSLDGLQVSTPTILIDGKQFTNWQTPGALLAAVNAAKS